MKKRRYRTARPVSTREPMHLILKSSVAKGLFSFRTARNRALVEVIVKAKCAKYGITLLEFANSYNHLHLLVSVSSRELYKRFIKAMSGAIAMAVTGACKTKPIASLIGRARFWDARPYSRVARGKRGFTTARDYVKLNELESDGVIPKRATRLKGVQERERSHFRRKHARSEVDSSSWKSPGLHEQLSFFS